MPAVRRETISYSSGNTGVAIPASRQNGDRLVFFAVRAGSTTPPLAATNWTTPTNGAPTGANLYAHRVSTKVWVTGDPDTVTIGNSNGGVIIVCYQGDPWGGAALVLQNSVGTGAVATLPALVMSDTDGSSRAGAFIATRDGTAIEAPDNMTEVVEQAGTSGRVSFSATPGGVTAYAADNNIAITGGTSSWRTVLFEILGPNDAPASVELPRIALALSPRAALAAPGSVDRALPRISLGLLPIAPVVSPGVVSRALPRIPLSLTPRALNRDPGEMSVSLPTIALQLTQPPLSAIPGTVSRALPRIGLSLTPLPFILNGGELSTMLPRILLRLLPKRPTPKATGAATVGLPRATLVLTPQPLVPTPDSVNRALPRITLVVSPRDLSARLLKPSPVVHKARATMTPNPSRATLGPISSAEFDQPDTRAEM